MTDSSGNRSVGIEVPLGSVTWLAKGEAVFDPVNKTWVPPRPPAVNSIQLVSPWTPSVEGPTDYPTWQALYVNGSCTLP
jgi:hypothetical protein